FASLSRGEKNRFRFPRLPHHPPCPPFARGGKGSLAREVIPSRATRTRVSKSSFQLSQHQLFTGPPLSCDLRLNRAGFFMQNKPNFRAVQDGSSPGIKWQSALAALPSVVPGP